MISICYNNLLICIIYYDINRLNYIRSILDNKDIEVVYINNDYKYYSLLSAIIKITAQEILNIKWALYLKSFNIYLYINFFKSIIINIYYVIKNGTRYYTIHNNVTNNHLFAWMLMHTKKKEQLVILEDDALFQTDSIDRLLNTIESVQVEKKPIFIDLAGGYSYSDLGVDHLIDFIDGDKVYFTKPVSNTACGYLINKEFIDISLKLIVSKPYLRLISIDWLINYVFMEFEKQQIESLSFHFSPTIFRHGSMTELKSLITD